MGDDAARWEHHVGTQYQVYAIEAHLEHCLGYIAALEADRARALEGERRWAEEVAVLRRLVDWLNGRSAVITSREYKCLNHGAEEADDA